MNHSPNNQEWKDAQAIIVLDMSEYENYYYVLYRQTDGTWWYEKGEGGIETYTAEEIKADIHNVVIPITEAMADIYNNWKCELNDCQCYTRRHSTHP